MRIRSPVHGRWSFWLSPLVGWSRGHGPRAYGSPSRDPHGALRTTPRIVPQVCVAHRERWRGGGWGGGGRGRKGRRQAEREGMPSEIGSALASSRRCSRIRSLLYPRFPHNTSAKGGEVYVVPAPSAAWFRGRGRPALSSASSISSSFVKEFLWLRQLISSMYSPSSARSAHLAQANAVPWRCFVVVAATGRSFGFICETQDDCYVCMRVCHACAEKRAACALNLGIATCTLLYASAGVLLLACACIGWEFGFRQHAPVLSQRWVLGLHCLLWRQFLAAGFPLQSRRRLIALTLRLKRALRVCLAA